MLKQQQGHIQMKREMHLNKYIIGTPICILGEVHKSYRFWYLSIKQWTGGSDTKIKCFLQSAVHSVEQYSAH